MTFCAKIIKYSLAGPGARSIPVSILRRELAEAADACSLFDNVKRAKTVVCLMLMSLELQPLLQRLPAGISGVLPTDEATLTSEDALTAKDTKTGQCGTLSNSSTQAPTSCHSAKWPTPKPSEWQDVELVAVRALTTLGWAVSTVSVTHTSVQDTDSLVEQLCQLLQHLVAGHLLDLDLDVQKLFDVGLQPVLDAQLQGHTESEGLAALMLSRFAIDSRLALQGQQCARQICYIFGESSQSIVVFDTSRNVGHARFRS